MKFLTFDELRIRLQELYASDDYAAALDLATQEFENFPEQAHFLNFWRISMASRLGNAEQAIQLLHNVVQSGYWYGQTLLRKSPSLRLLQGIPEFEQLTEINQRLQDLERERLFPLLTLRQQGQCKAGGPPCPLLLGLHANGSTAAASVDFWRSAASAGWLVAVPQSSQAMWKGAYVWNDRQLAVQEIQKDYQSIVEQYSTNPGQTLVAGHNEGGELAAWLSLTGSIPTIGFIAIAPRGTWLNSPENWASVLQSEPAFGQRGYVIVGAEDDPAVQENASAFVDELNKTGITCDLELVPHAGEDFDPAFAESLLRGIDFVLQR